MICALNPSTNPTLHPPTHTWQQPNRPPGIKNIKRVTVPVREKYAHAGQFCDSVSALQTDSEDCRPILGIISGRSWKQILYLCFLNHRNHRFKGGEFLEIVLLLQLQYICRRGGPEV